MAAWKPICPHTHLQSGEVTDSAADCWKRLEPVVINLCGKYWVFLKRKDRKTEQALIKKKKKKHVTQIMKMSWHFLLVTPNFQIPKSELNNQNNRVTAVPQVKRLASTSRTTAELQGTAVAQSYPGFNFWTQTIKVHDLKPQDVFKRKNNNICND